LIVFSVLVFSFFVLNFNFTFAASTSLTTKDATLVKITTATLNANVDTLANTNGIEYWFEYGTNSSNFNFKTTSSKSSVLGNVAQALTGLSSGSTYYFRACVKDTVSVSCFNTKSFTTYSTPSVSISSVTNVTDVAATISGTINSLGGNAATVSYWFEYGIGSSYSSKVSTTIKTTTSIGNVVANIISLKSNTTYYYKLCTKSDFTSANVCSTDNAFTTNVTVISPTDSRAPVVNNVAYEFTSPNSVKLKARLNNLGTFSSLNYYFEYGPNVNYGYSINESKTLTTASDFSLEIKNLSYGTTYYFRGCARDTVNTDNKYCTDPSYFTIIDYQNLPLAIGATTVSNIKDKSVRIDSAIDGFGGNNEIGVYANIIDSNYKTIQTPQIKVPYTLRNFSILIENLLPASSYKYSLCYYTPAKVSCSDKIETFTTIKNVVLGNVSSIVDVDKINLIANISDIGTSESNYANTKTWFAYTLDSNFKSNIILTTKKAYSNNNIVEIVSGLTKDVKYYYKFCANNGLEDVCSDVYSFIVSKVSSTPISPSNVKTPDVVPSDFSKLSSSSVKITGKVIDLGGDTSVLSYVSWGESKTSLKNTAQVSSSKIDSLIDFTITGLVENKKYYYKICSKNSVDTYCTDAYSFSLFKNQGSSAFLKVPTDFKKTKLDVKYSETMRGKILSQSQNKNALWYVNPVNLRRYYLGNYVNAYNVFKLIAVSVSDKDFAVFKDKKATSSYSGKIIFKASDPSILYYISPKDYRMWYFINQEEVEFIISKNIENITNANLLKIDYFDLSDVVYNVDKIDTDGDTLNDDLEVNIYGTNPYYLDTDGDNYPDNIEIQRGFSPVINGK